MRRLLQLQVLIALAAAATLAATQAPQEHVVVLEGVRIIDGLGGPPIERGSIVIKGDRIQSAGPSDAIPVPSDAEQIDLAGSTIIPGLIDLHFHIENDPKLALRQLSHGVTSFRDPGQWNEKFVELRRMIAADGLPGPRVVGQFEIDPRNQAPITHAIIATWRKRRNDRAIRMRSRHS